MFNIQERDKQWIIEHSSRFLETDTVFFAIALGFLVIPLKPHTQLDLPITICYHALPKMKPSAKSILAYTHDAAQRLRKLTGVLAPNAAFAPIHRQQPPRDTRCAAAVEVLAGLGVLTQKHHR